MPTPPTPTRTIQTEAEMRLERRRKLEAAARPLIQLLAEEYHPHHTAIVTNNRVELSEGLMSLKVEDYLKA
jgi:hypothetical protein